MQLALHHPKRNQSAARKARFPDRLTIYELNQAGNLSPVSGLVELYAKGKFANGGDAETMEGEEETLDTVLVMDWYPRIQNGKTGVLTLRDGTTKKRFTVSDVNSDGPNTLLSVTRKQ